MRIGIAAKIELFRRFRAALRNQPNLAGAAPHAVLFGAFFVTQRFKRSRKLDHMRNALLPVREERKFVSEILDRLVGARHGSEMRWNAAQNKAGSVATAAAARGDGRHRGLARLGDGADAGAD